LLGINSIARSPTRRLVKLIRIDQIQAHQDKSEPNPAGQAAFAVVIESSPARAPIRWNWDWVAALFFGSIVAKMDVLILYLLLSWRIVAVLAGLGVFAWNSWGGLIFELDSSGEDGMSHVF